MKMKIAQGYLGLCEKCDQDVWEPNCEWITIEFPPDLSEEGQKIAKRCEELGIPRATGCKVVQHKTCPSKDEIERKRWEGLTDQQKDSESNSWWI